jgi:hypothetical protein
MAFWERSRLSHDDPASMTRRAQGNRGDFRVIDTGHALELKLHLALLRTFADQTYQPSGQVADQQQNLKSLARAKARSTIAKATPYVLEIAEGLLNPHSLGIQPAKTG